MCSCTGPSWPSRGQLERARRSLHCDDRGVKICAEAHVSWGFTFPGNGSDAVLLGRRRPRARELSDASMDGHKYLENLDRCMPCNAVHGPRQRLSRATELNVQRSGKQLNNSCTERLLCLCRNCGRVVGAQRDPGGPRGSASCGLGESQAAVRAKRARGHYRSYECMPSPGPRRTSANGGTRSIRLFEGSYS